MAREHGIELKRGKRELSENSEHVPKKLTKYQGIERQETKNITEENPKKFSSRVLCPICGRFKMNKISLWKHIQVRHSNDYEKQTPCNTQRVVCYICGQQSSNKHSLLVHLENTHKDHHKSEMLLNNVGILCQGCGLTFSSKSSLRTHVRNEHKRQTFPGINIDYGKVGNNHESNTRLSADQGRLTEGFNHGVTS